MKPQNMYRVANLIERNPHRFDMMSPYKVEIKEGADKYTKGCIGGFCKGMFKGNDDCIRALVNVLGLTNDQAMQIMFVREIFVKYKEELGIEGRHNIVQYNQVKPHHAVMLLRKLAKGEWTFDPKDDDDTDL